MKVKVDVFSGSLGRYISEKVNVDVFYAPQKVKHIVTALSICPSIHPSIRPVPCLANNFKTAVGI